MFASATAFDDRHDYYPWGADPYNTTTLHHRYISPAAESGGMAMLLYLACLGVIVCSVCGRLNRPPGPPSRRGTHHQPVNDSNSGSDDEYETGSDDEPPLRGQLAVPPPTESIPEMAAVEATPSPLKPPDYEALCEGVPLSERNFGYL